jgi:hypothetical protein
MRPICERFEIIKSMKLIADRTVEVLQTLQPLYQVMNGRLMVSFKGQDIHQPSVTKKQAAVLRNLPLIADLFRITGVSLRELQVEDFQVFKTLQGELVSGVGLISGVDIVGIP